MASKSSDVLLFERVGKKKNIALITLNRPKARNAISPELAVKLVQSFQKVKDDPSIQVCIITGVGSCFCAGADLAQTITLLTKAREASDEFDRQVIRDEKMIDKAILRDFDVEKPVIAAIQGHAIAGGMELVQGCDIRVASKQARFGLQEVKWSLFPAGGSTVRLPRQIPYALAMELLLTGSLIDAEKAHSCGFLNYVTETDQVLSKAMEIAELIAANGPVAVKAIRKSVRECLGHPERIALAKETELAKGVFAHPDAKEGPRAFLEKRAPVWLSSKLQHTLVMNIP